MNEGTKGRFAKGRELRRGHEYGLNLGSVLQIEGHEKGFLERSTLR